MQFEDMQDSRTLHQYLILGSGGGGVGRVSRDVLDA